MIKKPVLTMFVAAAAIFTAHSGTVYYLNGPEAAGVIGDGADVSRALYGEYAGTFQELNGVRYPAFVANGEKSLLVWKFQRNANDRQAYRVDLSASLYLEAGATGATLAVGYDEYAGEHRTDSYISTNDISRITIDRALQTGGFTLSNAELLVVPPELDEFYVVLEVTSSASGGLAGRVEALDVTFTAIPAAPGEIVECPYWAAPKGLSHNVIDYGADPTGASDSAPAFQQALNQGGLIRVPAGSYRLDSTLYIRKSHTYIEGEGLPELVRQRLEGDADYSILVSVMAPGVRQMQDIRISGLALTVPDWRIPHLDNPSAAIALFGVYQGEVSDCVIRFPAHEGIRVFCGARNRVSNCTTFGARHGLTVGGNYRGYEAFDTQFADNQVYYGWDTGIVVGILTNRTLISGNLVAEIGCHAIDIFNCRDVTVTGNMIRNWLDPEVNFYPGDFGQAVGIFIHTDWGIIRDIPTENVTVTGNTLICDFDFTLPREQQRTANPATAAKYLSPIGIQVTGDLVRNVTISGNTVTGGAKGFYLTSLELVDQGPQGPVLDGTPQFITCVGNTFSGQKFSALEIESHSVPIKALVSNNLFVNIVPEGIIIPPNSGVTVRDNLLP